jgi:hypothetical protein
MSEWWTYRPTDFLMFSPRAYWRLFELHHAQWWPLHAVCSAAAVALVLVMAMSMALGKRWPLVWRLGGLGLAAATGWAAWAFVWQRYLPINWGARALAVALALVAVLVLGLIAQPRSALAPSHTLSPLRWRVGLGLIAGVAMLYPGVALIAGRPWTQGEWVGVAVDPTVLALLGWLLCAAPLTKAARIWWWATAVTALALGLASAATLATMGAMEAWLLSLALLLVVMMLRKR